MRTVHIATLASVVFLTLLVACESTSDPVAPKLQAMSFANSEWSAPVNLGSTINTTFNEQGPSLSNDGLSLYFGSDRPLGGAGSFDLWVSRRDCGDASDPKCAWQPPENLGPTVNTAASETGPGLSIDGHLLFFTSTRLGGPGGQDIYLSRRSNPNTDLGWEPPVALGPDVNTAANEAGAEYVQSAEDGAANFYFNRAPVGGTADLWTATRRSVHDPWSTPVNLGTPINSTLADQQPGLSTDGRALVFASSRSGSLGGTDIWMITRTPSGQ